jgi:hypothetical protein
MGVRLVKALVYHSSSKLAIISVNMESMGLDIREAKNMEWVVLC